MAPLVLPLPLPLLLVMALWASLPWWHHDPLGKVCWPVRLHQVAMELRLGPRLSDGAAELAHAEGGVGS